MAGVQDLVVAGGVEVMSQVPIGSPRRSASSTASGTRAAARLARRYGDQEISPVPRRRTDRRAWGLGRDGDGGVRAGEPRAGRCRAIDDGLFAEEIVPVDGIAEDEGPRRDTTAEKLAALKTLRPEGRLTAALASQISDGAAALLVASERRGRPARPHPARPRAHHGGRRLRPGADADRPDPGDREGAQAVGRRAGRHRRVRGQRGVRQRVDGLAKETGADPARTNPSGGAIALGHPLGGTGARLMTTLLHRMRRDGLRYGLQTMCEGGGMANATIFERA